MAGKKGQRSRKLAVIDRKRSLAMRRGIDGRTRDARYLRDTASQIAEDLGGPAELSVAKKVLVEQAAWNITRLRRMQWDAMQSGAFDDKSYSAMQNSLLGILGKLGLERKAKKVLSAQEVIAAESDSP